MKNLKKKRKKELKKEIIRLGGDPKGKNQKELERLNVDLKKSVKLERTKNLDKFEDYDGPIPIEASVNEKMEEEDGSKRIVFSFADYKKKLCELADFDLEHTKVLMSELKDASSKSVNKYSNITLVHNNNEYKKLYEAVPKESKVYEITLKGESRLFFYRISDSNYYYIVAITLKHYETG